MRKKKHGYIKKHLPHTYISQKDLRKRLTFTALKKLDALCDDRISNHNHVLGHVLNKRQEAAFCIEPCVCP